MHGTEASVKAGHGNYPHLTCCSQIRFVDERVVSDIQNEYSQPLLTVLVSEGNVLSLKTSRPTYVSLTRSLFYYYMLNVNLFFVCDSLYMMMTYTCNDRWFSWHQRHESCVLRDSLIFSSALLEECLE